jgi:hypothetical protein
MGQAESTALRKESKMHHDSGTGGSSRKHHTQHDERGKSNYPLRLQDRGLSKAPVMASLDGLRHRQAWMTVYVARGETVPQTRPDVLPDWPDSIGSNYLDISEDYADERISV